MGLLHRFSVIAPGAALLAVLTATAAAGAPDETSLYGLWSTPGGNVVDIRPEPQGLLQGTLVHVGSEGQALGFARGDPALRRFRLGDPATVAFEISTRATAGDSGCPPPDWLPFEGSMVGPDSIVGDVIAPQFEIVAASGRCREVGRGRTRLPPYQRFAFVRQDVWPPREVFTVERAGPEELTVDATADAPRGLPGLDGAPAVRVTTVDGQPVAFAEVEWLLEPTRPGEVEPRSYVTETDAQGRARLRLTLLPNGRFVPFNQVRQEHQPLTVPGGRWRVTARVPELGVRRAVEFGLTLRGPGALVAFLEPQGPPTSELVIPVTAVGRDVEVGLRVVDLTGSGLATVRVSLQSHLMRYPRGPGDPLPFPEDAAYSTTHCDLPRVRRGVFESSPDLRLSFWPSVRSCVLRLPSQADAIRVTAQIDQPRLVVQHLHVYLTGPGAAEAKLRSYLRYAYENLDYLRGRDTVGDPHTGRAQKDLVEQKLGYVERAFALLNDPPDASGRVNNRVQLFAAHAYVDLLGTSTYQPPVPNLKASLYNGLAREDPARVLVPAGDAREKASLEAASLRAVQSRNWEAGRDVLLGSVPTLDQIRATADQLVASPFEMAWVIAFGETWSGERRDVVDRLLLGLEIASFRIGTPRLLDDVWEMAQRGRAGRQARQRVRQARAAGVEVDLREAHDGARFRRRLREERRTATPDEVRALEERIEADLLRVAWENPGIPADLRRRLRYIMHRLAVSRSASGLIKALDQAEEVIRRDPKKASSARGRLACRIGLLEHSLKAQQEAAYWRSLVQQGHARMVVPDHHFVSADGTLEVFIEYQLARDQRVDYALARHFDDRIELHVVDLTGQLRSQKITDLGSAKTQHLEKTVKYGDTFHTALEQRYPHKAIVLRATELYWRENDVEGRLDQLVRTMGLFR